ncbi:MAG: head GIN domain-containing protein [Bacteroidota bacterium]
MENIYFTKGRQIMLLIAFVFFATLSSCSFGISGTERIKGSGEVISELRELPYFNAIDVSNSFDVFITMGEEFHVEIKADDNIVPLVITEVIDDVLEISIERNYSIRKAKSQELHITMPMLLSIKASGATSVKLENRLDSEALYVQASGASDVMLDANLSYLEIKFSGASDLKITGFSESVKARLSGASDMKDYDFVCNFLDANLSGASDIRITANEKVSGKLSGASDINLKGDPLVVVSTSGASSVIKR